MVIIRSRWTIAASAFVVGAVVFLGGAVIANGDDTYTGCLNNGGNLTNIAIGTEPASPCRGDSEAITWSATGPTGPVGPQGPDGADGADGAPGPAGSIGFYKHVENFDWVVRAHTTNFEDVYCDTGDFATGFGGSIGGINDVELIYASQQGNNYYRFSWRNSTDTDETLGVGGQVMCADIAAPYRATP